MIPSFPHALVELEARPTETLAKNSYRSEMESGIARQSPIDSLAIKRRNVTYVTGSKDDYLEFLDWYKNEINFGNSFFLWQDYMDGDWKRVRIIPDDLDCRPMDAALNHWKINLTLEGIEE